LKINFKRLILSNFIIGGLALISFTITFACQENGEFNNLLYYSCKWCFLLIAFPDMLFSELPSMQNPLGLALGVLIGCMFYAILIEYLSFNLYKHRIKESG